MGQNNNFSNLQYMNLVIQFFVEVFIGLAVGYYGGQYLDRLIFDDKKILVYVLLVLGIFSAIINLARRALKLNEKEEGGKENEEQKD